MNETLKQEAADALVQILRDAASVREFAIEQAPDVIQQLLTWKLLEASATAALCFVLCLLAIAGIRFLWRRDWDDSMDRTFARVMSSVIGGAMAMLLLAVSLDYAFQALQIAIAPKVWLLEYAADLVRGAA